MRKIFLVCSLLICIVIALCSCGNNSVAKKMNISEIEKLSFCTPNEKEMFLSESDKKTVLNILADAKLSEKRDELDGGICINAYVNDAVKYNISIYDPDHISISTDFDDMYQISESDYITVCSIIEELK